MNCRSRARTCGATSRLASTRGSKTPNPKLRSEVPDVLGPNLRVVFVGINPGRVSAAAHAHFANPRNDFWRLLHAAGFTPRLYEPNEQFALLEEGIGVTNAAGRTTPGSGDLRRADFAGSAERLEKIAHDLRPGWLAFVGKEAYRGTFTERPELGLQKRTLAETRLFVLPSTSPANAAVPWKERLRWFHDLAGRASGLPIRDAVRAAIVAPDGRILMLHYANEHDEWWIPPGGGVDPGESDEQALRRELREELGLEDFEVGPLLFESARFFLLEGGYGGQRNRVYLVRLSYFEARVVSEARDARWFTFDDLDRERGRPWEYEELLNSSSDW